MVAVAARPEIEQLRISPAASGEVQLRRNRSQEEPARLSELQETTISSDGPRCMLEAR